MYQAFTAFGNIYQVFTTFCNIYQAFTPFGNIYKVTANSGLSISAWIHPSDFVTFR